MSIFTGILCCIYLGNFLTYKENKVKERGRRKKIGNDKSEL